MKKEQSEFKSTVTDGISGGRRLQKSEMEQKSHEKLSKNLSSRLVGQGETV